MTIASSLAGDAVQQPSGRAGRGQWVRSAMCGGLVLLLVPAGIIWRMAPLGLPQFAWKYGGSVLWAIAVYWTIAGTRPRWPTQRLALSATFVAYGVEFFKLLRLAPVDRFRATLAGKLLLGRYFSVGALVAYGLGILLASAMDAWVRPGR